MGAIESMDLVGGPAPAALFFDVDGTLVWHRPDAGVGESVVSGRPSEGVYRAFAELSSRGHKTFICTGRPLCLVSDALRDLHPTGLVAGAGATVVVDGGIVFSDPIPSDLVDEAAQRFLDLGAAVMFEGSTACVSLAAPSRECVDFPGVETVRSVAELHRAASGSTFDKVSFANSEVSLIRRDSEFFDRHFTICDLGVGLSEMSVIGTDKGSGIRHALDALGMADARTFAFGDSENDLAMFGAVDVPVAMGNALPRVKEAAVYVTDAVEHDGVVSALRHFGLI